MARWLVFAMIAFLTVQRYDLAVVKIALGSTRISELLAIGALFLLMLDAAIASGIRLRAPKRMTSLILLFLGVMFLSSLNSSQITSGLNLHTWVRRPDREVPFLKSYTTILSWIWHRRFLRSDLDDKHS